MDAQLDTAGERLHLSGELGWVDDVLAEGAAGQLRPGGDAVATVRLHVERARAAFVHPSARRVGRGIAQEGSRVWIDDVAGSGFDLFVDGTSDPLQMVLRWRPSAAERSAARLLRSRLHLLVRAVVLQYPAMWVAGTRGRVPLHVSALTAGDVPVVLAGAGGIGKSTLVAAEAAAGAAVVSDNLCVSDGTSVWGVVEPARLATGTGRRMPHGRREAPLPNRAGALMPAAAVVVSRGAGPAPALVRTSVDNLARSLVCGTYLAGELRRYWGYAAALAAGTGRGPAHPPVTEVAYVVARSMPCWELQLGDRAGVRLSELLPVEEPVPCR